MCFAKRRGYGWRRSPCKNAHCLHCGWSGEIRSRDFERAYGAARCRKSATGWHTVNIIAERNENPDVLRLRFECLECHVQGACAIDPVSNIEWSAIEEL